MNLRKKCLSIVAATTFCLLVILYVVSQYVLLSGFKKVEREDTEQNVNRLLDAFAEALNNLCVKSADWAQWDDTYRFIQDHNQEYIQSNLPDNIFSDLKIDLILFFDDEKRLIFSRGFDEEKGVSVSLTQKEIDSIRADTLIMNHQSIESIVAGVEVFPKGPMRIVSRPILRSSGQGPIRGTLLFASYIDKKEIDRLGRITHLSVMFQPFDAAAAAPDILQAKKNIDDQRPIYTFPIDKSRIAGYTRIIDLHGSPEFIARIEMPRHIYKQGLLTMVYLVLFILGAGLIFGIIIIVLLQKIVLSRLWQLSTDANLIATHGDHTARVRTFGNDELGDLSRSINDMLSALEAVESQVKITNRQMRIIMNTVPSGLLSIDENYHINPGYSKSVETILGKKDLVHKNFFDSLGLSGERLDDRNTLSEYLDLLVKEPLSETEMAILNPFDEIKIKNGDGNNEIWIKLSFFIIHRDEGSQKHLLVVFNNITKEKELSERVKQSEQENFQLKTIAEDFDLFREYLTDTRRRLSFVNERLGQFPTVIDQRPVVHELFREIHTVKGASDVFGFQTVVEIAGQLEEFIDAMRETNDFSDRHIEATKISLEHLSQAIDRVAENAKKIWGDEYSDDSDIHLHIPLEKFKTGCTAITTMIKSELGDGTIALQLIKTIESNVRKFREVPARRGLAWVFRLVPGLIRKFDKNILFEVKGSEIQIDCEIARELTAPIVQLLRNAIDHGIENIEEREAVGKPSRGHVQVIVNEDSRYLIIKVTDDGRGIDPTFLKKIALEKNMLTKNEAAGMTDEDALKLILKPGFTTIKKASDVSGKGVGMDVVQNAVSYRLKGEMTIASRIGQGTTFTLFVPLRTIDSDVSPNLSLELLSGS
jgi:sensor domain CHASE-containing protein/signal transduction histidine kinase